MATNPGVLLRPDRLHRLQGVPDRMQGQARHPSALSGSRPWPRRNPYWSHERPGTRVPLPGGVGPTLRRGDHGRARVRRAPHTRGGQRRGGGRPGARLPGRPRSAPAAGTARPGGRSGPARVGRVRPGRRRPRAPRGSHRLHGGIAGTQARGGGGPDGAAPHAPGPRRTGDAGVATARPPAAPGGPRRPAWPRRGGHHTAPAAAAGDGFPARRDGDADRSAGRTGGP